MPLTAPQLTIADCDKRFRVAICGRRFGKTHLSVRELAKFARVPKSRVWYIAPTRGQGKGIVWEQLKARLQSLRWLKKVNESDLTLHLVNGSEISIKSADAYDRMRGFSVNFVVLDEFADMDEGVWTALRPTLSDKQGHAFFIGTPRGMSNWSKDMFDMSLTNENWASFQYTTIDGGQVTEEEIEAARNEMDEHSFREEYLATFESKSGRIFYAFDRHHSLKKHTGIVPNEIHIGLDFNVANLCGCIAEKTATGLHIFDELRLTSSNTDEVVQEIRTRFPTQKIIVYPDPAGNQSRTSAGGRTDHTILRTAGFTVKTHNVTKSVRDGINAVNSLFTNSRGEHRLFVDPRCRNVIESMEKHCYKEGSNLPDKDSGFDHMSDALRYLTEYLYPIRQPVAPLPTRMWSNKIA